MTLNVIKYMKIVNSELIFIYILLQMVLQSPNTFLVTLISFISMSRVSLFSRSHMQPQVDLSLQAKLGSASSTPGNLSVALGTTARLHCTVTNVEHQAVRIFFIWISKNRFDFRSPGSGFLTIASWQMAWSPSQQMTGSVFCTSPGEMSGPYRSAECRPGTRESTSVRLQPPRGLSVV